MHVLLQLECTKSDCVTVDHNKNHDEIYVDSNTITN